MSTILIKNATVLTMDSSRRIIEDGAVFINGNRVEAVGKTDEIAKNYKAEKVFNGHGKAVLPGLVNTHNHLWCILTKGMGTDLPLVNWLNSCLHLMAPNLRENDFYLSGLLANIEAIKSGCTTNADFAYFHLKTQPNGAKKIIQSFQDTGVRCVYGRGMCDTGAEAGVTPDIIENTKDSLNQADNLIREYNGTSDGMIRIWVAPAAIFINTTELLVGCRELANKYKTGIMMHIAETADFDAYARQVYHMGELDYYNSIGLLGPDVLGAHCVWIDDRGIRIFRDKDVKVSHNPTSNMFLHDGIAPIPRFIEAGVTVGMATDGAGSNGNLDMISALKHAALLHKVHIDAAAITAEKVLEMATIDGSKCLGMQDEVGSIEKGKKADLIIMNLKNPHIAPVSSLSQSLVYSATSECVETSIINGKVVMENRRITTVDEEKVVDDIIKITDELVVKSNMLHFKERPWKTIAY